MPATMGLCMLVASHDFHQTSLLGAAQLLKEREAELKGTVRFDFSTSRGKFPRGLSGH